MRRKLCCQVVVPLARLYVGHALSGMDIDTSFLHTHNLKFVFVIYFPILLLPACSNEFRSLSFNTFSQSDFAGRCCLKSYSRQEKQQEVKYSRSVSPAWAWCSADGSQRPLPHSSWSLQRDLRLFQIPITTLLSV